LDAAKAFSAAFSCDAIDAAPIAPLSPDARTLGITFAAARAAPAESPAAFAAA
jgi:hypothetical protein